uniref:Glycoprotein Ib platelet subunit beta n=1 Tax=Erpetoichthys calabaricus TaxID=27687 RepID=A0A8C4T741_ERPCA
MKFHSSLAILCCLQLAVAHRCPQKCYCSHGTVDCSGRGLTIDMLPPGFPSDAMLLHLNDNKLTEISKGLFDSLTHLKLVSLQGNPWHCDCNILYLHSWLFKQENRTLYKNIVCHSPASLKGRLIMYLTEDEVLSTCQYWYCNLAVISQACLFIFIIIQAILLIFLITFLRRFEKLSKEASRTARDTLVDFD